MGLDTSHNCWHGAYSAYFRWRANLLTQTGQFTVTRDQFEYIGPTEEWPLYAPLAYLMEHSDCDGTIPVEAQLELAECLERQIILYPDGSWGGHIGPWHATTQQFVDGLRRAHAAGEEVIFS